MSFNITLPVKTDYNSEYIYLWATCYCTKAPSVIAKAFYDTNDYIPDRREYIYTFENEADATLFGLRWL